MGSLLMASNLQLVVVTPETTLINEPVDAVRFPLFDGQMGVLPGRLPLVGRLGSGEMTLSTSSGNRSYFVDGGFVQIRGETVTLLTSRCLNASDINVETVTQELQQATVRPAASDIEIDARLRDQERARRMLSAARK